MPDSDINDDGKLYQRYCNKRVNSEKEGVDFDLTYKQFCRLVRNKRLLSSHLGFHSGSKNYVLARIRDRGSYTYGNCRFITQAENALEKRVTPRSKLASRRNAKAMTAMNKRTDPKIVSERIKAGMDSYNKKRREDAENRRSSRAARLNPSYAGKNNSQYGSFWITDGVTNKKWRLELGKLPKGFYRGRAV